MRGNIDEPVALETSLGWVASGPMKNSAAVEGAQEVGAIFVGNCSV